jgi:hypothetical protein
VAEWISAIGTSAAAAGALLLLWKERQSLNILRRDRERDQASKVAAWIMHSKPADAGRMLVTLALINNSDEPVFDVTAEAENQRDRILPLGEWDVLGPRAEIKDEKVVHSIQNVNSGSLIFQPPRIAIRFRDAQGRKWTRDFDGTLTRLVG